MTNEQQDQPLATCTVSGCGGVPTCFVRFNHPNESLRWEANMCHACATEAHERAKGGLGVLTFAPPKAGKSAQLLELRWLVKELLDNCSFFKSAIDSGTDLDLEQWHERATKAMEKSQ